MGFKFNSGRGGIICEKCRALICAGWREPWEYIYSTTKENHLVLMSKDGRELHYCSVYCRDKHNAKFHNKEKV